MKASSTKFISNKGILFAILVLMLSTTTLSTSAQTETLTTGSYIINMGIVPQTEANGLKPYGLLYDLLKNNQVPIKWVISQSKVKDGVDFTYNSVQYKGGTFIIPFEYRTAAVNAKITSYGVTGATTTTPLTVNVTHTLKFAPKWVLDNSNNNVNIAKNFFVLAGIPTSAYVDKTPAQLTGCDDIYVMPHATATWATYGPLLNWVTNNKGSFWGGCQTASNIENCFNPGNTAQQLNFLSNNVGAAGNALVPEGSHADGTPPYSYLNPTSVAAQFMGGVEDAQQNGSEQIYLPKLAGSWRPTTEVISFDPTQANVPGLSPGPAASIVYGRAFGNSNYGFAMYEGGHDIDDGSGDDRIAAMRAFWNFSFRAAMIKDPASATISLADIQVGGSGYQASVTVTSGDAPFTYLWTSSCGGTFSSPTAQSTTFTPPFVANFTYCTITCQVTDACGRTGFTTKIIQVFPPKTNPDFNSTYLNQPVTGNVNTNDYLPLSATYSTSPTLVSSPGGSTATLTMNSNGSYNFVGNQPGVYSYIVPACVSNNVNVTPATGGTITNSGGFITHRFTSNGTFTAPNAMTVEALVVAGGGGGAGNGNSTEHCMGSGGAGGLIYNASFAVTAGAKTVTIGAGGTAGSGGSNPTGNNATNGGNSVFATLTATGGGAGRQSGAGAAGGSGGGGGAWGGAGTGGAASPAGQGNAGANGTTGTVTSHGGGGGGSAAAGGVGTGTGGAGTSYSISGAPVVYAAGGSHGAAIGAANTGNGGGGALDNSGAGGNGGSGVVIVRYPTTTSVTTCYDTRLVITVLTPCIETNPPVANVDITHTLLNAPVTLKTLANDRPGSASLALVPSSVSVTIAPLHGTTTVNALTGDITYTPTTNYIGFDTLTYQVCDNQGTPKCATARQVFEVTSTGSPNPNYTIGADDYAITNYNTAVSGNVKLNDSDPEGDVQNIPAQTTTVPGKGTLVLQANGDYTFTPANNYSGPVDFIYSLTDVGRTPVASANATLHVLVRPQCVISISGHVWIDADIVNPFGVDKDLPIGSSIAVPNFLAVYLIDNTTGKVVDLSGIVNDAFIFQNVAPNKNYRIQLSQFSYDVGDDLPSNPPINQFFLPTPFFNKGEWLGPELDEKDGNANGELFVPVLFQNVINANFGLFIRNGAVVTG